MAENKKEAPEKRLAKKIKPNKGPEPYNVAPNKLKLLITIVNRNKTDYFLDLLQSFEINMQMVLIGRGTANAKMLDLLGLTDTDKGVILSVIQETNIPEAMNTLEEKFKTIKDGKGVAFTIAFSSVIGTLIYGFLSNNQEAVKENRQ